MKRRELHFETLSQADDECTRLLESGYVKNGNWSLGQTCRHMRLTIDASIDGYPWWMSLAAPLRPLIRWAMLPRLLAGKSPAGLKTPRMFVPSDDAKDAAEVELLRDSIARFVEHDGYLHPHPGFGKLPHGVLEEFHAMHAAHHLGFLDDAQSEPIESD